jgi:protein Tex
MENSVETEAQESPLETPELEPKVDPKDVKPKSAMDHWLKRQFPGHTLKGMQEALRQLDAGTPVPFLAFFGGDKTDGLKSADLYKLLDAKVEWEEISRKQKHLSTEINAQGKLDDATKQQIERSTDLDRLEDIYAPFKLKRQTLGVQAREAGLGPLADFLWNTAHGIETPALPGETLLEKAAPFAKPDTKFADAESVLKGVQDILVERIAESFELRSLVRSTVFRRSKIRAAKGSKAKANSKYSKFFEYQEPIGSLKKPSASHRYLAMRRGWMEDELTLSFERPDEGILLEKFEEFASPSKDSIGHEILSQAARLALKGSVFTVMENEAHRHLKEEAERHVIETLAENLRKKILRPGLGRKAVLGIDPGSTTQPCSLALVDVDGKLLVHMPFKLEEVSDSGKAEFLQSLENLKIEAIAVAHGPRSKEVREGFRKILVEAGRNLPIISVHEHTSSIYSSSPAGKEEFPALDVNSRRAVFVARYLQDPLSMILRLDPKFLSLGEFQHEVNQSKLRAALNRAIEVSVNFVGVNPNFAPAHVLSYVSGLNAETAKAVAQARTKAHFQTREDFKKVPGLEAKFEFLAGFLRLPESAERLDSTFIHPNHYSKVKEFAAAKGAADPFSLSPEQLNELETDAAFAEAVGAAIVKNIRYELSHPGEDPRGAFRAFEYDPALKTLSDLKPQTAYPGVVTNVTSFGAFVDLGIDQDGLVHISELSDALAKNPFDSLFPGDPVTVFVSGVNEEKKQISLTMKSPVDRPERRPRGERRPRPEGQKRREPRETRPERPKRPVGPPPPGAPIIGADGSVIAPAAPQQPAREMRDPRDEARRGGGGGERGRGGPRGGSRESEGQRPRRDEKDRKPKKPTRDPKTGAVVNLDEERGARGADRGPKVPTKTQPHTFNPFANLGNLLKEKQGKSQE